MSDDVPGAPKLRPFWGLALANTLSNITIPLASLTDVAVLGRLPNPEPLAAVAFAGVIFDYLLWSLGFLRMGVTSETACAWGSDNGSQLRNTLREHLVLAAVLGLVMLASAPGILALSEYALTPAPSLFADLRAYFSARILGAPCALVNYVIIGWLLGLGHSRAALALAVAGKGLHAALNFILVLHWGQGAAGVGYADTAGQVSITIGGALYISSLILWRRLPTPDDGEAGASRRPHGYRMFIADVRLSLRRLLRLLASHSDLFVRTLMLITAFALLVRLSASTSVLMVAATSLWLRVFTLMSFLIGGPGLAIEPYAGVLWARGQPAVLHARLRQVLGVALLVSVIAIAALAAAPLFWLGLLTTLPELSAPALTLLPGLLLTLLFSGTACVYDGLFLGLGQARILRNATTLSFVGFGVVVAVASFSGSAVGLWYAIAVLMAGRTFTLAYGWRGLMRVAPQPFAITPAH